MRYVKWVYFLKPDESFYVELALIPRRADDQGAGNGHLESLRQVKGAAKRLKQLYNSSSECLDSEPNRAYSANVGVYPNPTTGMLYHNIAETGFADNLVLYNVSGQILRRSGPASQMNLSGLNSGVYFLRMAYQNKVKVVKVIKN